MCVIKISVAVTKMSVLRYLDLKAGTFIWPMILTVVTSCPIAFGPVVTQYIMMGAYS